MPQKVIKLKEAIEFVKNNGYLLAIYKKEGDNYKLYCDCYTVSDVDIEILVIVNTTGAATDFNEFTTKDKEYYFRLYNNFNIPNVIPIIPDNEF